MAIPERLRKRIEEQKKDWIVINAAVKLTEENKQLQSRLKKAEDLLEDCWNQFAYRDEEKRKDYTKPAQVLRRYSGGLSTLEALDSYLSAKGIIDDSGLFKWDEGKELRINGKDED